MSDIYDPWGDTRWRRVTGHFVRNRDDELEQEIYQAGGSRYVFLGRHVTIGHGWGQVRFVLKPWGTLEWDGRQEAMWRRR